MHRSAHFSLPALLMMAALSACRITDHSERDGTIGTGDIHFPVTGDGEVDPGKLPAITFDRTHFDMGRVVQGTKVDHRFTFTNTGGSALVITDVRGSCGCTVGKEWPREPVPPGSSAHIEVSFDSEGRSGRQDKTVTIVANTNPPSHVLTLGGEVVAPAAP